MTRRFVVVATLVLAGLVVAAGALPLMAQGRGPGGRGGFGGPGRLGGPGGPNLVAMFRHLDLTDAQRDQLRAILQAEKPAADQEENARTAEQKLHAAIFGDGADPASIDALKAAVNAVHAAELDRRVEIMQKVAPILTPAQREQLLKLPPNHPPRH